jgi:hypothetical protein
VFQSNFWKKFEQKKAEESSFWKKLEQKGNKLPVAQI